MARLTWHGDEVLEKVNEAAKTAVDRTVEDCVDQARILHPWHNRTGFLEESIWVMQGATSRGTKITARWGSDAPYALYLEIGTSRRGSGAPRAEIRARLANGNMNEVTPPLPADHPLMSPRAYLRPAADIYYRLLKVRVGQVFRGERML